MTGLSTHVIRVWERRYGAVAPGRSVTRHRMFSEEEIDRLILLARLKGTGRSIGTIAGLPTSELRDLLNNGTLASNIIVSDASFPLLENARRAVAGYESAALEGIMDRATTLFGYSGMLERVLVPLLRQVGDDWQAGNITAAQEHAATSVIKDYLARTLRSIDTPASAPTLLVATPAGQMHEMGAAIAAGLARKAGWNVIYLGTSLPAGEIAGAAIANRVRAIALSIVYPADDPALGEEMHRLRNLVPAGLPIVVGGNAARAYHAVLTAVEAIMVEDLGDFTRHLATLRRLPTAKVSDLEF